METNSLGLLMTSHRLKAVDGVNSELAQITGCVGELSQKWLELHGPPSAKGESSLLTRAIQLENSRRSPTVVYNLLISICLLK